MIPMTPNTHFPHVCLSPSANHLHILRSKFTYVATVFQPEALKIWVTRSHTFILPVIYWYTELIYFLLIISLVAAMAPNEHSPTKMLKCESRDFLKKHYQHQIEMAALQKKSYQSEPSSMPGMSCGPTSLSDTSMTNTFQFAARPMS